MHFYQTCIQHITIRITNRTLVDNILSTYLDSLILHSQYLDIIRIESPNSSFRQKEPPKEHKEVEDPKELFDKYIDGEDPIRSTEYKILCNRIIYISIWARKLPRFLY